MINFIFSNKKYFIIGGALFLLLIIFACFSVFSKENDTIEKEEENIFLTDTKEETIEESTPIWIDIKGAVKSPGTYSLKENSRVQDAILLAGGLTDSADTSTINLSKILQDEMVIIIYTKQEIEEMKQGSTSVKYIEKECICPKLENDACIDKNLTVTNQDTKEEPTTPSGKISINQATIEQLTTLPGIGEKKAQDIIAYREKNGPFQNLEDLKNVKGIGDATFEKLKEYIML